MSLKKSMTLDEWMNLNGVSNQDLAEKIGCDRTLVSHFRNGTRTPVLEDAFKIEEITFGAVKAKSFLKDENA